MYAIDISHISKWFGDKQALNDITFQVKSGELFGLIGADGAGKSTLFDILVTLSKADAGSARVAQYDVQKEHKKIRRIIGCMPGKFSLYLDLTVLENLNFFATIFGSSIDDSYELIKDIWEQIKPFGNRPAGKLSGGMKQKLALCCALVHQPQVLFLDEPTTGVDPVSRKEFWNMLKQLQQKGISILVSTPYMDEAVLCDRVALIQEGNILAIDTPDGITRIFDKPLWSVQTANRYQLLTDLRLFAHTHSCYAFGQTVHLSVTGAGISEELIRAYLREKGHDSISISAISPGIEDCFMELMQKTA